MKPVSGAKRPESALRSKPAANELDNRTCSNQSLKETLVRILESAGLRDFEIMETLEKLASHFIRV